jgi:hypothetical protein
LARIIPNENTWIGFATDGTITTINAPTAAQVAAAKDLTGWCISLNASSRGNTVPTPSFDSLFETSTAGTSAATFDADFYRDDGANNDDAWDTLPRGTRGYFIISRFGGTGTANLPIATNKVEVWPVMITSRTMANMASNTVLTFTVSCAVTTEPAENATVAA